MAPTATTASGAPQSTRNLDPFHACATCGHEQWTSPPSSDMAGTKHALPAGLPTIDAAVWGQLTQLAAKFTKALDGDMRTLSLAIHGRPELKFQETFAADTLCTYLERLEDWTVERGICKLPTAWSARWTSPYGLGDRTVGFNSEMDALPGIGHACGHNLIAVAGVAAALGTARALEACKLPGRIVLLGTPAEEGGGGKCFLLKDGAYADMDACFMVHPAPFHGLGSSLAIKRVTVTYRGRTAHAAATPWAGINALDAAVLAYNGVSVLRQQTEDRVRIQGIVLPEPSWAQNVIPDVSRLSFGIRAPTFKQVDHYLSRVLNCFQGASTATGCTVEIEVDPVSYDDILYSPPLGNIYEEYMTGTEGIAVLRNLPFSGSTDFGNVTQNLPGLHPIYAIPVKDVQKDANHTAAFHTAAGTPEAHTETMKSAAGIAVTAALFAADERFASVVTEDWKRGKLASEEVGGMY